MYLGQQVTTIIPALNESSVIGNVIQALFSLEANGTQVIDRIVVCDNGSTDNTAEISTALGAVVVYEPCRGYGAACLKAVGAVMHTDILVFVNADGSEKIQELPDLLDPILKHGADLVIGSRMLGVPEIHALSPQQIFGNRLASLLIRAIWKAPVTDLGPFRAIRFPAYRCLQMRDQDYGWTIEMQLKAIRYGLNMIEVPVTALCGKTPSVISGTLRGALGAAYKIIGTILLYGFIDKLLPQKLHVQGTVGRNL